MDGPLAITFIAFAFGFYLSVRGSFSGFRWTEEIKRKPMRWWIALLIYCAIGWFGGGWLSEAFPRFSVVLLPICVAILFGLNSWQLHKQKSNSTVASSTTNPGGPSESN